MISQNKYIVKNSSSIGTVKKQEVGGKGFNLFKLNEFGFRIPAWYVVTSNCFMETVGPHRKRINKILSETNFSDFDKISRSSLLIADIVCSLKIEKNILKEIQSTFAEMFYRENSVSVRSSILDEDSIENSFAGQMDSFLCVPPENVIETIKKVWASAYSARALVYRNKKELDMEDISAAVIIQKMINSVSSGITFTSDPEGISNDVIITAGYGLGEGIVQDSVETDTYRLDKKTHLLKCDIGNKQTKVVPGKLRGTLIQRAVFDMQSRKVLNDLQISELFNTALKIETEFGIPQDVEWAFNNNGELMLLQSRPVIFRRSKSPTNGTTVWDNSNIVESYSGITLPLTFSFILSGYEANFRAAILSLLGYRNDATVDLNIFKNMIGLIHGRVYYNLLNWYRMLSYLPHFESYRESWDRMIGIENKIEFPGKKLSLYNRIVCNLKLCRMLLFVNGSARKFFKHFNKYFGESNNKVVNHKDLASYIDVYRRLESELLPKWYLTLYSDITSMKYYTWLNKLCFKWGLQKYPGIHNDLLQGIQDIESAKPVERILEITDIIKKDVAYSSLMSIDDDEIIWNKIQDNTMYEELKRLLSKYLSEYGDRCPEELKLEKPTYREHPEELIKIIKAYFKSNLSSDLLFRENNRKYLESEKLVRSTLTNPFKRFAFDLVLHNARSSVRNRENMRFARSRAYGLVRRIFNMIGDIFAEQQILENKEDIFYLTINEIFGYIEGTSVTLDLKRLVELRRNEYGTYESIEFDDRIIHKGIPYIEIKPKISGQAPALNSLHGIGCSSGISRANAAVVLNPNSININGKFILVTRSTDPGWIFLMISSKGIITEKGSMLSHSAIMGREFGIPSIVNVNDATKLITNGSMIEMNGETGEVKCI